MYSCIGEKVQYYHPCCVYNGAINRCFLLQRLGLYAEEYVHKMAGFCKSFIFDFVSGILIMISLFTLR